MSDVWQLPPALACQDCDVPLFYSAEDIIAKFRDYFSEIISTCPGCRNKLDWWTTVLHTIRGGSRYADPLNAVGARQTAFMITLQPGLPTVVRFAEHTIPTEAQILRVSYYQAYPKNSGGLAPLELHGTTPFRYTIPAEVTLYPMPIREGAVSKTHINVAVLWMPHTSDDEALRQLVAAFDAFGQQRFVEAIVPANVAVESTIASIIGQFLERTASRDNVKRFMNDGATYSHQINVLLPALLSFTSAPKLPDHIRGQLKRLREYRNDIAHTGAARRPFNQDAVAECLCAALFSFHYLKVVRPILLS